MDFQVKSQGTLPQHLKDQRHTAQTPRIRTNGPGINIRAPKPPFNQTNDTHAGASRITAGELQWH